MSAIKSTPISSLPERPPEAGGLRSPRLAMSTTVLEPAAASALRSAMFAFHRGEPGAHDALATPGDGFTPVTMDRFRDPGRVRGADPCCLVVDEASGAPAALTLDELLAESVDRFASAGGARVLRDNLARLERAIRSELAGRSGPQPASAVITCAGRSMREQLALSADSDRQLADDLAQLVEHLSSDAQLLALDASSLVTLLWYGARGTIERGRATFREDVDRLRRHVNEYLRATDTATDAASIGAAIGGGGAFLDASRLADVVGSTPKGHGPDEAVKARLRDVVGRLEAFLAADPGDAVVVASSVRAPAGIPAGVAWHAVDPGTASRAAAEGFESAAQSHAAVCGAMRVARLLLDGSYDSPRHDPMLRMFDWRAFTAAEMAAMPLYVALESARDVVASDMLDLSRALRTGRPVTTVVVVQPSGDPGAVDDNDPLGVFRVELAYFGISHREAGVHQSSIAQPGHLLAGLTDAVVNRGASLHVIAETGDWLHAGAAVSARAHPFVRYRPDAGSTWARRMDIDGNPQPDADWPAYDIDIVDAGGDAASLTVRFTFADYALLDPDRRAEFRVIPPEADDADLVPVDAFLARPPDGIESRIPFVWATDGDGTLHRLIVRRTLAMAARDRLDFWNTLQELAGVRNEYVREAVERERETLEARFETETRERATAAERAIEQARRSGAQEALSQLAEALVRGDRAIGALRSDGRVPQSVAATGVDVPVTAPPAPDDSGVGVQSEPAPPIATEVAPVEDEIQEPWIDSVLCTSCNDCLAINPRLFVYNGDKQAIIGDPSAGTYEELVRAAEKCPARCIHPGLPLDDAQPDLDALIKRAKPFN